MKLSGMRGIASMVVVINGYCHFARNITHSKSYVICYFLLFWVRVRVYMRLSVVVDFLALALFKFLFMMLF